MADYVARSSVILNGQQADDQLENLGKKAKELRQEMKKLREANDKSGYDKVARKLKEVNKETRQLKKETFSVEKVLKNLSGASFKEIATAARKANAEFKAMKQTDPGYAKKAAQVKILNTKVRELSALTRTQQGLWSRAASGFNKFFGMATAAIASFAGVVMGMKRMKGVLDDFEETITNVYTLLDEADFNQFKDMLDEGSIELLRKYGFEITDINKALFDTISAGVPAAESIIFMNEAAVLAKGGVTSLSTSVDGMTTIINAYGLEMDQASEVSSAFFTAQKYGKTTVEALASSIGTAVPIAAQAGVGYRELLSAVSALTTQGISTDMAMTSVKNAFQSLLKPGKEAEKILREFGVPVGATEVRAKGLGYTLERLNKVMLENPDAIAKAIPNIRGLTAVSALSGEGLKKYHEILAKVNTDFGEGSSLMGAYTKQMETDVQKMKTAGGKLKATILDMGDTLRPIFTEAIRLSNWSFRTLLKVVKLLIQHKGIILTLATALTTYAIALRLSNIKLAENIILTKTKNLWTKITTASTYLAAAAQALMTGNIKRANIAMKLFNKTTKLNPVILLISILAAAGVALYQYSKKLDEVSAAQKTINDVELTAQQNIVERKVKMEQLMAVAKNDNLSLETRKKALKDLNEISPEYFGNLTLEKINTEEATTATEEYTEALLKKARIQAAEEKLIELEKQRIEAMQSGSDYQNKWYQTAWNGVKSFGNAAAFASNQAISGANNATDAEANYIAQKEALIGVIGEQTKAIDILNNTGGNDSGGAAQTSPLDALLKANTETQQDAIRKYFADAGEGAFEAFIAAIEKSQAEKALPFSLTEDEEEQFDPSTDYAIQKHKQTLEFKLALNESMYQQGLIGEQQYQDQLTELTRQAEDKRFKIKQENIEKARDMAYLASNFVGALMDLELEKAGDNEDKKKEIRKKYADLNFAVTAAQIIANTAGAIMQGYAQLGPIGGAIAAVLLGATGIVQLGVANAQRKKTKTFATGKYPDKEYAGRPQTGMYGDKPQLGIFNEVPGQPEMVIDGITTRNINVNYPGIMEAIYAVRDGRTPQFADGKYTDASSSVLSPLAREDAEGRGVSTTDPQILAALNANTQAMNNLRKWQPAIAVDLYEKKREQYNEIETKSGL